MRRIQAATVPVMTALRARVAWARAWGGSHPLGLDALVAFALLVLATLGLFHNASPSLPHRDPDALGVLLAAAVSLPIALRRRFPWAVLLVVLPGAVLLTGLHFGDAGSPVAVLVALYSLAVNCPPRRSLQG